MLNTALNTGPGPGPWDTYYKAGILISGPTKTQVSSISAGQIQADRIICPHLYEIALQCSISIQFIASPQIQTGEMKCKIKTHVVFIMHEKGDY